MRTKSAWLLAFPFLLLARPTPALLGVGAGIAVLGVLLRGWSAGSIRKDEALTTSGPYAHLRHPLYVGSFLIGMGLAVAGGHWIWSVLVIVFFASVYRPSIAAERERLTRLFGADYLEYARAVPALLPRLTPYRPTAPRVANPRMDGPPVAERTVSSAGFTWSRYLRNREWEALLGSAAALAVLAAKAHWLG